MTEQGKDRGRSTAAKVLMPVIATVASALASYIAKKGPEFLEQTVMPKLRETKDKTGGVGDVAHDLTDRARSVAGGGSSDESLSTDELEQRRRERKEHRASRRKAS